MNKKSVYKFAAEAGLPVGLYLICISACFLLSLRVEALQLLIFPLAIGFPFLLGWLMKRVMREEPSYCRFSPLWLFGIYTVIFGTLICMLFSSVWLVFVDPGFINNYVTHSIDAIQSLPTADQYRATVEVMQEALDSHLLPSGTQFVTSMGWFTSFSGAILSLIEALFISRMAARKRYTMFR